VLLRAGHRAVDQTGSLKEASMVHVVEKGVWEDQSGALSKSLNTAEVEKDSLKIVSDIPYARYVFYGTSHNTAMPPRVDEDRLVDQVVRRVANDLVGE
jgi:hypothetical protein